jgi:hypothetical protein
LVPQNVIGWSLDAWPPIESGGRHPAAAGWGMALTPALQAVAAVWLLWRRNAGC